MNVPAKTLAVSITGSLAISIALISTFVLAVLKLTGTIAWSWFWVLSPLIAGTTFYGLMAILFGVATYKLVKDWV